MLRKPLTLLALALAAVCTASAEEVEIIGTLQVRIACADTHHEQIVMVRQQAPTTTASCNSSRWTTITKWWTSTSWSTSRRPISKPRTENLAQPGTDKVKVVRFDRSAHNATTRPNYDLWVSYRVKGVGHDSSLNKHWDCKVNIHYCLTASDRPSDSPANPNWYNWWGWVYYYTNNNVAQLLPGGDYTDPDGGLCKVRFLREDNPGNQSAVIQLIDPNGNQPPSIPSGQDISISTTSPSLFFHPKSSPAAVSPHSFLKFFLTSYIADSEPQLSAIPCYHSFYPNNSTCVRFA